LTDESHLNYGLAVRTLRDDRRMTLDALADAAGVSASYLSEIERGLKRPSSDVVAKVAKAFGMSPSGLLEYVETISGHGVVAYMMAPKDQPPRPMPAEPPVAAPSAETSPHLRLLISHARQLDEGDLKTLVDLARRLLRKEKS